jgi:phosphate-selective porin OprO and OprP
MKTIPRFILICLVVLFSRADLFAQSPAPTIADLERRIKELENIVQGKTTTLPPLVAKPADDIASPPIIRPMADNAPPTPPIVNPTEDNTAAPIKAPAPFAGWDDGFYLKSADRAYILRLTGQLQADYRAYGDHNDTKDIDTFLVRRARLGIEATVFDYYEFRLLPDFGQGKAVIQDSYINVHYVDWLQLQAGKFKEPVSYEQLIQDRFVPTLERSIIDQIVPARDVGLMVHGQKLFGDRFDYGVGIFNGGINGGSSPSTSGDFDTNNGKDFAARVAVRPFNSDLFFEPLRWLQVGISGTFGNEKELIVPGTFRTPGNVPWLQFNPGVAAGGTRTRYTPEISYFYGPLGFATQYIHEMQEMRPSLTSKNVLAVPMDGYYFLATLLLTGETRTTFSAPVKPLRPYEPCHPLVSPGAWELVARLSRLSLDSEIFNAGADQLANPKLYSNRATELTLGFNWYLNPWVRMQFNWEHSWFGDRVTLGDKSVRINAQDAFLTRFQVIF